MNTTISTTTKLALVLTAILLVVSMFVPLWQIDLDAPQYPEGLGLTISANGLGGDVDIINGLNHYIGMKTLHNEDFIEFTILVYIIAFFAAFSLITAFIGKKKLLYTLFIAFVLFGIVAMVDFWKWEYQYGHDLDPKAAIIVPGMAYQPPLIGFKQLLNFGAYSVPHIGGWLFIASGLLMLLTVIKETNMMNKFKKTKMQTSLILIAFTTLFQFSCTNKGPEPINFNKDNCDYCKMTLTEENFACELITEKSKVYKFDDIRCMIGFDGENKDKTKNASFYISDFLAPHALTSNTKLHFVASENIGSPMGGNIAAFTNKDSATVYATKLSVTTIAWEDINH